MSVDIKSIKEKVLLVNIVNTYYENRIDLDNALEDLTYNDEKLCREEKIQGAAQCFWLLDENKLETCKYVFAVCGGKIQGVFRLCENQKFLYANKVESEKGKIPYVNYPPYRDIEIKAHTHNSREEVQAKIRKLVANKELFEEVVSQIPAKEENDFRFWNIRKFLCLTPCSENEHIRAKYENQDLTRNGGKFRFYGAIEYCPKGN